MNPMKMISAFIFAAIIDGGMWWTYFLAKTSPDQQTVSMLEIVQLGGTGGLIIALVTAVASLWKSLNKLTDQHASTITSMRSEHWQYIDAMQKTHHEELQRLSDNYTAELKSQIEVLRQESHATYQKKD